MLRLGAEYRCKNFSIDCIDLYIKLKIFTLSLGDHEFGSKLRHMHTWLRGHKIKTGSLSRSKLASYSGPFQPEQHLPFMDVCEHMYMEESKRESFSVSVLNCHVKPHKEQFENMWRLALCFSEEINVLASNLLVAVM